MEEAATPDNPLPKEKIYSNVVILVSTILTGPISGGYMLAGNFKAFGERRRSMWTLIISIIGTTLLMTVVSLSFLDRIPPVAFSAAIAWTIYYVARHYQSEKIAAHYQAGGQNAGFGRIILVNVLGGVLTAILAFAGVYLVEPAQTVATKNYGTLQHDMGYDPANIPVEEVDRIADALTRAIYFDSESKKTVDVTKEDGRYELFLYCADSVRNNREAFEVYADLRNDVQKSFPDNKIVIILVVNTQDNVVKRLE